MAEQLVKMIYDSDREMIDPNQASCVSLGCAGKLIAFVELLFFSFVFFAAKDYLTGELWKGLKWGAL